MKKCRKSAIGGVSWNPLAVCCVSVHTNTGEGAKPAMICRRDTQTAGCPDACYPTVRVRQKGTRGDAKTQNAGETTPSDSPTHASKERVSQGFFVVLVFLQLRAVKNHESGYTTPESDGNFAVGPSTFFPSQAGSRGRPVSTYCGGGGVRAGASKQAIDSLAGMREGESDAQ